jgi:hypothetical protein
MRCGRRVTRVSRGLLRRKGRTRFFLMFFGICNALNLSRFFCGFFHREVIPAIERLFQILLQVLYLRDVTRDGQIAQRHRFALVRTLWRRD